MINRYLDNVRSREPHERRTHALKAAAVLTGLFAVAWLATLPMRLNTDTLSAQNADQAAAAAAAAQSDSGQLEVASTTPYNY